MSVSPKDFLESAVGLAGAGPDEMTQRNAISRAYYSAYHRACEFIKPEASEEKVGVHKRYINQLNKGANGSIERKIAGRIKAMYLRRRVADYFLQDNLETYATALQLSTANDLFFIIESAEKGVGGVSQPQPSPFTLKVVK